jgi:hypothetical protein
MFLMGGVECRRRFVNRDGYAERQGAFDQPPNGQTSSSKVSSFNKYCRICGGNGDLVHPANLLSGFAMLVMAW